MRSRGLTLLSLLLLAAQALSATVPKEAQDTQETAVVGHPPRPVGRFRHGASKSTTSGKFVTRDQASCHWTVTKREQLSTLKAECTQMGQEFSCVFAGNLTECLKHNDEMIYWKQIFQTLRKQKDLCRTFTVLKTSVCRKQFPESNLKLINSTFIENLEPQETATTFSLGKDIDATLYPVSSRVKEDIPSSPAEDQNYSFKIPNCPDNPDVKRTLDQVLEFCSPVWALDTFWCTFFTKKLESITC